MKPKRIASILLIFLLHAVLAAAPPSIEVTDAWIREAPPGADVLAAYMQISNRGEQTFTIESFESPDFERIELHRTRMQGGIARMVPVESLPIDPAARVALEPGGLHLMLYKPGRALHAGERAAVRICGSGGSCIRIEIPIVRQGPAEADAHHHHHH